MSRITYLAEQISTMRLEKEKSVKKVNKAYATKIKSIEKTLTSELVGFAFNDEKNRNWYFVDSYYMNDEGKPRFVLKCIDKRFHTVHTKKCKINFILQLSDNEISSTEFIKEWKSIEKLIKKERQELKDAVRDYNYKSY